MADNTRKNVEANLRSVTQSCKGGVPLDRLERDYRELLGTPIPYRELGFSSLEQMVRGMPDVIKVGRNEMGMLTVMGVADKTTAHIESLVARQKAPKSRKIPVGRPRFRVSSTRGAHHRQPFTNFPRSKYQPSYRPMAQRRPQPPSRNQFVRPEPVRQSKVEEWKETPSTRPHYSAPSKPEPREEPWRDSAPAATSAIKKPSPPPPMIPKSNYEMPPRFLRKQAEPHWSARVIQKVIKPPSPVEDPVPPKYFPSNTEPIPPPAPLPRRNETPFFVPNEIPELPITLGQSLHLVNKIPSPKPKISKERRKPPSPIPHAGDSPVDFVKEYARANGLDCKFVTRQAGQRRKSFNSALTLGTKSYRSYPEVPYCSTEAEAEEVAASLAMQAILEEDSKPKYPIIELEVADQIHMFVNRIEEILVDRSKGLWSTRLPKEYETKYLESLPTNWLEVLKQNISNNIDIEFHDTRKDYVLRYIRNSGDVTPSSSSSKSSHFNEEGYLSMNENSTERLANYAPVIVPPLELPEGTTWEIYVTFVFSTTNIGVRLIDQNDNFNNMSSDMQTFYHGQCVPIAVPVVGMLYVAHQCIEQVDYYFRVRVTEIIANVKMAVCYFVDIGETAPLNCTELYDLDPQFGKLPFQAIHITLDGLELEEYTELMEVDNLVDKLLDKSLIAEIITRNESTIVAILHDTSGPLNINLNELLRESTILLSLSISLPELGSTSMCFLTHASIEGEIYLRCNKPMESLLEIEMDKNISKFEEAPAISRSQLSSDAIFVTKYVNGFWYRAVIWPGSEANNEGVELFYVDYGNTSFVSWEYIKDLGCISKFLASLPFQALPCVLKDVPPPHSCWSEASLTKLYEIAPEEQELIVKVAKDGDETSPSEVQLYRRNEYSELISINQTILMSKDLFSPITVNGAVSSIAAVKPSSLQLHSNEIHPNIPFESSANNFITSPSVLWAPTPDAGNDPIELVSGAPPPPEIPEVDQLFNVYITYVASPSNFVVQSLKNATALSTLLDDMNACYQVEDDLIDMHKCLLKEDSYYAARHSDGNWYRAKVKNIDEGNNVVVAVHFIDYGDFATVGLSDLQPLYQQFKVLPCQAIKASLHGIRPISSDWLPEQCFEARQLMNERQFASVVKGKRRNEKDEFGEWTLNIVLIDVSLPDKDVLVHEMLIEKELAIAAS